MKMFRLLFLCFLQVSFLIAIHGQGYGQESDYSNPSPSQGSDYSEQKPQPQSSYPVAKPQPATQPKPAYPAPPPLYSKPKEDAKSDQYEQKPSDDYEQKPDSSGYASKPIYKRQVLVSTISSVEQLNSTTEIPTTRKPLGARRIRHAQPYIELARHRRQASTITTVSSTDNATVAENLTTTEEVPEGLTNSTEDTEEPVTTSQPILGGRRPFQRQSRQAPPGEVEQTETTSLLSTSTGSSEGSLATEESTTKVTTKSTLLGSRTFRRQRRQGSGNPSTTVLASTTVSATTSKGTAVETSRPPLTGRRAHHHKHSTDATTTAATKIST